MKNNEEIIAETEAVIKILSKRAVRRKPLTEEQKKLIKKKIAKDGFVRLAGYWGVGDKPRPTEIDETALDRLRDITEQSNEVIFFTLILADKHGEMNGYPRQHCRGYLAGVEKLAKTKSREIATCWLSDLYDKFQISIPEGSEIGNEIWELFPPEYYEALVERAKKHYKGNKRPEDDAKRYLMMVKKEEIIWEYLFRRKGFLPFSFGDPSLLELYPKNTFFLWIKRGRGNLPWFSS